MHFTVKVKKCIFSHSIKSNYNSYKILHNIDYCNNLISCWSFMLVKVFIISLVMNICPHF